MVEFANEQDRNYYDKEDPAHGAFKKFLRAGKVEKVGVLDYKDGVY